MRRALTIAVGIALLALALSAPAVVTAHPHGAYDEIIKGTTGADTLKGGDGKDKILGRPGNDVLWGQKGRDLLQGGSGNDILRGGNLHDELYGGKGADKISGGPGNDVMYGGPGRDRFFGGPGNDVIRADGDGARDMVDCGGGTGDRAFVDARDIVTGCETVIVKGQ